MIGVPAAPMLAVVPVRDELPAGAGEAAAEAQGQVLVIGRNAAAAAKDLVGIASHLQVCEAGNFAPARWAQALSSTIDDRHRVLVLPASPDGRDLAPRLAQAMGRPLHTGAARVSADQVTLVRHGGRAEAVVDISEPCVVTFALGARNAVPTARPLPKVIEIDLALDRTPDAADAELVAELPADPATMDLVEARRIVGAGAGLDGQARLEQLGRIGAVLGASLGATRVVTDAGWTGHERQIGTTGVEVDPELYLAFGISGAVQHVMGLGDPDHIIAVNTDASCPMMAMADLALVTDANLVLDELAALDLETP